MAEPKLHVDVKDAIEKARSDCTEQEWAFLVGELFEE